MRDHKALTFVIIASALAVACKKKPKPEGGSAAPPSPSASTDEAASVTTRAVEPAKTKPSAGCTLPPEVGADVTLTKGCALTVKERTTIGNGATLTIEPGVKLSFDPDAMLYIEHGRIAAKGAADAPILFTSTSGRPAPGDWAGIRFSDQTMAETIFDHVVIEGAGRNAAGARGALTIASAQGLARRISVTASVIRNNDQCGVYANPGDFAFAKFEGNMLDGNPIAMHVHANVLGSVGADNKFSSPVEVEGDLTITSTWPAAVPIHITGSMSIGGTQGPAILTLADGTLMKVAMASSLVIGTDQGGGIVGKRVTFTSLNATPSEGDWVGLRFMDKATGVALDGGTIAFAGRDEGGGQGAVTLANGVKPGPSLRIINTTFKSNKQAAISAPEGECGDLDAASSGNKSEGVALCAKPR
jgi:hypothetical protein